MARFDVYANPGTHARTPPYLLDVQSDLLDGLDSRMVIPLRCREQFPQVTLPARLIPALQIEGRDYLLETPKMAAVPRKILKTPVSSLAAEHIHITAALYCLLQDY